MHLVWVRITHRTGASLRAHTHLCVCVCVCAACVYLYVCFSLSLVVFSAFVYAYGFSFSCCVFCLWVMCVHVNFSLFLDVCLYAFCICLNARVCAGATCSAAAGFIGMWVSIHTNVRVASVACRSYLEVGWLFTNTSICLY